MKTLQSFCKKYVGILFVLFLLNALILSYLGSGLKIYTDLPKLDFMLHGYSITDVQNLFDAYGEEGLHTYFWLTIIDIPFPFILFMFVYGYSATTLKKWNLWLYSFVMAAVSSFLLFDIIENILILFLILIGVNTVGDFWIAISSLATQIKLFSLIIVYASLILTWLVSVILRKKYFIFGENHKK